MVWVERQRKKINQSVTHELKNIKKKQFWKKNQRGKEDKWKDIEVKIKKMETEEKYKKKQKKDTKKN